MNFKIPTEEDLVREIKSATRAAYKKLIQSHPGNYYYFCLNTSGDATAPVLSAWSIEALEETAKNLKEKKYFKWSYAESPYYLFGQELFLEVEQLFLRRPDIRYLSLEDREKEFNLRLNSMETALKELDLEGLFGKNNLRNRIVINAEVMPPDYTNTERAIRLNPPEAIVDWLQEASEVE